jgi:uncharacterized protein (UPF0147 family)
MYFDEGRHLNQPQYGNKEARNVVHPSVERAHEPVCRSEQAQSCRGRGTVARSPKDWKSADQLDAMNNQLQEVMQLLYLLSRDVAVPSDARYHVTVAQAEIALLARQIHNSAEAKAAISQSNDRSDASPKLHR